MRESAWTLNSETRLAKCNGNLKVQPTRLRWGVFAASQSVRRTFSKQTVARMASRTTARRWAASKADSQMQVLCCVVFPRPRRALRLPSPARQQPSSGNSGSAWAAARRLFEWFEWHSRNYFVHSTGQGAGHSWHLAFSEKKGFGEAEASGRPVDLLEELAQLVENNKNGRVPSFFRNLQTCKGRS